MFLDEENTEEMPAAEADTASTEEAPASTEETTEEVA